MGSGADVLLASPVGDEADAGEVWLPGWMRLGRFVSRQAK